MRNHKLRFDGCSMYFIFLKYLCTHPFYTFYQAEKISPIFPKYPINSLMKLNELSNYQH
uniref:Uncharacterized protein n=1 Tax=Rhizophora mucronata TaxID=61149 RepID=A0A2P2NU43_RHIMU